MNVLTNQWQPVVYYIFINATGSLAVMEYNEDGSVCSMAFAHGISFDTDELKVIVDKTSLELIDGTEIDFVKEGINEAFKFRNPNTTSECGCGESFSV